MHFSLGIDNLINCLESQFLDTLSNNLDISNIRNVVPSYKYTTKIKGWVLRFKHDNNMLPTTQDVSVNSHGFVQLKALLICDVHQANAFSNRALLNINLQATGILLAEVTILSDREHVK